MENKQFIALLGKRLNREHSEVSTLVDGLCKVFKEYGSELDSIAIPGFGTFKTVKKDELIILDQTSGKRTLLPPYISMDFTPSIVLRKKLMKQ